MTEPRQQMSNHWEGTSCPPTAPPHHQSLLSLTHDAHNMGMLFCILTDPRCDVALDPAARHMTCLTVAVRTLLAYGKYDGTNTAVELRMVVKTFLQTRVIPTTSSSPTKYASPDRPRCIVKSASTSAESAGNLAKLRHESNQVQYGQKHARPIRCNALQGQNV